MEGCFWKDPTAFNQTLWLFCISSGAFAGLIAAWVGRKYSGLGDLGFASTGGLILGAIVGLGVALLLTGELKETPTAIGAAASLAMSGGYLVIRMAPLAKPG